jgi:hypothetical protein
VVIAAYQAVELASSNATASGDVDAVEKKPKKQKKVSILDNLDVTPPAKKIELERRGLVNLEQKGEGDDPFNFFQEGMDPANENPLRVSNEEGKIEISVGGAAYTDGERDGHNATAITPLEFSETAQRYHLVNTYDGGPSYELLFNVDRQTKSARVWMREHDKGAWSSWESACDYGR